MLLHKHYKELVETLFKEDTNIDSSYYEEVDGGPDKFHVVFNEDVNGEGYADFMTWYLLDELKITKSMVVVSIWINVDAILDNVFNKSEK
jgi:hypothetical protein